METLHLRLARPRSIPIIVDVARVGPNVSADLLTGKGRVFVTLSGVFGDSGIPSPTWFMLARGQIRERFLETWKTYGSAEASRYIIRGVHRPVVTRTSDMMTTMATGYDNRDMLPPFLPFGSGEDSLYGVILEATQESAYFGHVPMALLHAQKAGRSYGPLLTGIRLSDVLECMVGDAPKLHRSPAEALKQIGRHLIECGSIERYDFSCYLQKIGRRFSLVLLEHCERTRSASLGKPEFWAKELDVWIRKLEAAIVSPTVGVPEDVSPLDESSPYARTQKCILEFGKVLLWWPDIIDGARRLREAGQMLCQPVIG
jgi:hypothetical protein